MGGFQLFVFSFKVSFKIKPVRQILGWNGFLPTLTTILAQFLKRNKSYVFVSRCPFSFPFTWSQCLPLSCNFFSFSCASSPPLLPSPGLWLLFLYLFLFFDWFFYSVFSLLSSLFKVSIFVVSSSPLLLLHRFVIFVSIVVVSILIWFLVSEIRFLNFLFASDSNPLLIVICYTKIHPIFNYYKTQI